MHELPDELGVMKLLPYLCKANSHKVDLNAWCLQHARSC